MNTVAEGPAVLKQFGALSFIENRIENYAPVFHMAKKSGIE
jgi:hypothetical protein